MKEKALHIGMGFIFVMSLFGAGYSLHLTGRVESFQAFYLNGKQYKCSYTPRQWEINHLTHQLEFAKAKKE